MNDVEGIKPRYYEAINVLQKAAKVVMQVVIENDGHIRQMITDDKGTVMILVFGLGSSQESSQVEVAAAVHGLRSALEIGSKLDEIDINAKIGEINSSSFVLKFFIYALLYSLFVLKSFVYALLYFSFVTLCGRRHNRDCLLWFGG